MKNPNGYGTVYKLPGRRRKPWAAIVTSGYELVDGKAKQKRASIGYYASRKEATDALAKFNADPYQLGFTFEEVFKRWREIKEKEITDGSMKAYDKAYTRFSLLHDKRFDKITTKDLERVFALTVASDRSKVNMKNLINQMYEYAVNRDIVVKNMADRFSVKVPKTEIERRPFTDEEIQYLWDCPEQPAKITLILIYTGLRINEILRMEIDTEEWVFRGGSKTPAGMHRLVPIREKIRPLLKYIEDESYNALYQRVLYFQKKMNHTTHDCRVTFLTRYKDADDTAIKLIVGHRIEDMTKRVYVKYTLDELRKIIDSVDF